MKKIDINTYTEACEDLRIAKMSFNAGSQDIALEMLESLAFYVVSDRAQSMVEADKLQQLAEDVKGTLGQFSCSGEECLWEKSCEILDLFREYKYAIIK